MSTGGWYQPYWARKAHFFPASGDSLCGRHSRPLVEGGLQAGAYGDHPPSLPYCRICLSRLLANDPRTAVKSITFTLSQWQGDNNA